MLCVIQAFYGVRFVCLTNCNLDPLICCSLSACLKVYLRLMGAKVFKNIREACWYALSCLIWHRKPPSLFLTHINVLLHILAEPMCSEGCGLSVSGQAPPRLDGVIPSMVDGSKFFPSHNPSVGQNSGSFVAILICVTKLQNDCLLPNQGSH